MNQIEIVQSIDVPAIPGTPFSGGLFVARYAIGGELFGLIDSGASGEIAEAQWGVRGLDVPGARSFIDGLGNTRAMAEAGSEVAAQVLALELGGKKDWGIPARDQMELEYRHMKPTTAENYCTWRDGENTYAVPTTYRYTREDPAQTIAPAYQQGAAHAFKPEYYLSSTQYVPHGAYIQHFAHGNHGAGGKGDRWRVRPVRIVKIIN